MHRAKNLWIATPLFVTAILASSPAFAASDQTPDASAEVVYLRKSCTVAGAQMENCFETLAELTGPSGTGWVWQTRQPSASSPLLIDIGPGDFQGSFECSGGKRVSVRGSGREHTFIRRTATNVPVINVVNCDYLAFEDLTAVADGLGWKPTVSWSGKGRGTWTDVDLLALRPDGFTVAWVDLNASPQKPSLHYFFNARVQAVGNGPSVYAFAGNSSDVWFYGGEFLTHFTGARSVSAPSEAFNVTTSHEIHAFGAAFRMKVDETALPTNPNVYPIDGDENKAPNVWLYGYGDFEPKFHMHGGIISSLSEDDDLDIVSIYLDASGNEMVAHTPDTAFNITTGPNATPYRLLSSNTNNSKMLSPFLWQSGSTPPTSSTEANRLSSQDGSDTYVETDCDACGDCNPATNSGASEPHLMVYASANCGAQNPWFDTVTGVCRGQTPSSCNSLLP